MGPACCGNNQDDSTRDHIPNKKILRRDVDSMPEL